MISHASKPKVFPSVEVAIKLGRYVGRGNPKSIAAAAVQNKVVHHQLLEAISSESRQEVYSICSDHHNSILWLKSKPALENFSWDTVWKELTKEVPTLTSFVQRLLPVGKRNTAVQPALCLCVTIILKLNKKVNLVHSVISLIIKAGHCTEAVRLC